MQKGNILITICFCLLLSAVVIPGWNIVREHKASTPKEKNSNTAASADNTGETKKNTKEVPTEEEEQETVSLIQADGKTLQKRILTPEGYERTKAKENSLGNFIRNYPMKKDGSSVLLYNGQKKGNQNAHVAVFKLPIENEDLQQCADSVMRMYGEYYYQRGDYDKISFSLGNGFEANFRKWSNGNTIGFDGTNFYWMSSSKNDSSYPSFQKFMRIVFAYAGTMTLEEESHKISLNKIRIGDIFIKGGSPGHVVMVVDRCKNAEGQKAFLLAQGYMPAQEFHVLKNPLHEKDPWYYTDEITYPFVTPEYTFQQGSLRRPDY
ncbi:MAG: DUF4846 domain-containing protein [Lachnospiraceae bacterium]|nr:DUF4846 domain-containing protein [Lachnospiraceae bacterium]